MIKFERIDTQEKFDAWREFAKTFDHDTDRPAMPIIMVTNDQNQAIGHFHIMKQPVVFPAFHPSITKREFRDSVEGLGRYLEISSMDQQFPNGVSFVAINLDNGFSPEIIDKLGYKSTGFTLYRRIP